MQADGLKATTLLLSLLLVFFSLITSAQNNNKHDISLPDDLYELLESKEKLIKEDALESKNEWAGLYLVGDHHPTVLIWSPNQGFLAYGSNHTMNPSRLNFGKATFADKILRVEPEIAKDHLHFQSIPLELVPVKWGEQHFLIERSDMARFAYAVHSRSEMQLEWYLRMSGNHEKSRKGMPDLPSQYQKIVSMASIRPRIVSIGKAEDLYEKQIILDLGSKAGIIKHTLFYLKSGDNYLILAIDEVSEKTSKATVHSMGGLNDKFEPRVGMRLSSKMPAGFIEN